MTDQHKSEPSAGEPVDQHGISACPFCGERLIYSSGKFNKVGYCRTEGCWLADRKITVPTDDPRQVQQFNTRPSPAPDKIAPGGEANGNGWVFWNPDSGEEYAPNHPLESGEVPDAVNIRRSTAQEDVLWQAFQGEAERAHALSTPPAPEVEVEAALTALSERIESAEQDLADDYADAEETGERVDLAEPVVELELGFARSILAALASPARNMVASEDQVEAVAQVDRNAVVRLLEAGGQDWQAKEIRLGDGDHFPIVQAFKNHRIAALQASPATPDAVAALWAASMWRKAITNTITLVDMARKEHPARPENKAMSAFDARLYDLMEKWFSFSRGTDPRSYGESEAEWKRFLSVLNAGEGDRG